jgi:hypothetical protein
MVDAVKEHCEFLSTLRAVAGEQMSQEDFEAAVQKSLTIIKQELMAVRSLKPPEATEILTLLGGTTLTSGSLAALAQEILAKVGITRGRPVGTPCRQPQQSCLYIHNLLCEHQWEKILSDVLSWDQKENYFVDIMDELGLSNATERTKTLVTCILFMASSREETITVNKVEFFEKRTALNAKMTTHFKRRAAHHGQVDNYPETGEEFRRRFPDAAAIFYRKDQATSYNAVACPLDLLALRSFAERMPTRKTHGEIAVAVRMHTLPKGFNKSGVGQLCRGGSGTLGRLVQNYVDRKEIEECLPGLTFLRREPPPPPGSSRSPALCDAPANGQHASEQQAMAPSCRPSGLQALENGATTSLVPMFPPAGFMGESKSVDAMAELLLRRSKGAGSDSTASSLAASAKKPGPKKQCLKRPAAAALVSTSPKAAKVAIKLASTSPKAAKVSNKLASTAAKAQKVEMKCPGVTKKAKPAIQVRHWRVYTDVRQGGWRCKRIGDRQDKMCSWKIDPKAGWAKLLAIVSGK